MFSTILRAAPRIGVASVRAAGSRATSRFCGATFAGAGAAELAGAPSPSIARGCAAAEAVPETEAAGSPFAPASSSK